jgi:hypothetical protein
LKPPHKELPPNDPELDAVWDSFFPAVPVPEEAGAKFLGLAEPGFSWTCAQKDAEGGTASRSKDSFRTNKYSIQQTLNIHL